MRWSKRPEQKFFLKSRTLSLPKGSNHYRYENFKADILQAIGIPRSARNFTSSLALVASLVTLSSAQSGRFAPAPASTPQISSRPSSTPPRPSDVPKRALPELFVIIDPSHGGEDRGAVLAGNLLEKDVTLALARDLKRRLEEHGIPVRLLRDSDRTLSLDQRAELTNEARPSLYVALHAGPSGTGARVYTSAVAFTAQPVAGRLVSWENAQVSALDRSQSVARAVAAEIGRLEGRVDNMAAPLRPLNNLVIPAIAVEFTAISRSPQSRHQQEAIASAVASGIAQVRGIIGAPP
jgi:N-acetylmuramoyl-L-alanine amidase